MVMKYTFLKDISYNYNNTILSKSHIFKSKKVQVEEMKEKNKEFVEGLMSLKNISTKIENNLLIKKDVEIPGENFRNIPITFDTSKKGIDFEIGMEILKIVNALPFCILLVDDKHNILLVNEAVKKDLNLDPQNLVGKYCPMVIHGLNHPIPQCPLEDAVEKGCAVEREIFDQSNQRWFVSAIYPTQFKTRDGRELYFHMVRDITEKKNAQKRLKQSLDKLQKITRDVIKAMTTMVEKKDPYTAGHQQRVSRLANEMAKEMQLPERQIEGIRIAALVHDIGKIAVPTEILSKPGKISECEFNIIKTHSQVGYDILKEIDFPWPVAEAVLQHHERMDGSGYPGGLSGEDIIIEARILSVADVVEAMASHRPYRKAHGIEKALEEISRNKGTLYDKEVVEACLKLFLEKKFKF